MGDGTDDVASLRPALAAAEQARDKAVADAAAAERQWRDERQEELNRLRNLFSVVRVIARRTSDDARSVEDYCRLLEGRLSSYLGAHAAVARDWDGGSDLAVLVADQLLTFLLKEGERVQLAGPPVKLKSRAAVLMSLAFHELAIAAVLAGRLEGGGNLQVSWSLQGQAQGLQIDWMESAADHAAGDERQTSWAEWIEQAIAHQLAGSMSFAEPAAGRSVTFRLPSSVII